jgi:hypothetical protein
MGDSCSREARAVNPLQWECDARSRGTNAWRRRLVLIAPDAAASHARGQFSNERVGLTVAVLELRLDDDPPIALGNAVHARNARRAARITRRRVEELIFADESLTNFK